MRTITKFCIIIGILIGIAGCNTAPDPEAQRLLETREKITLCAAEQCETLNIDRGDLEDYTILNQLPHVTALRASWTDFDDLNDLSGMPQLRELHVSSTDVHNLQPLTLFPELEVLHIQWDSKITDFTPLGQATSLTELALGGMNLGDLSYLADLSSLDGLSLRSATLTSFEGLRGHPALTRLDLEYSNLSDDIDVLLTIPGLKQVSIISDGGRTQAQQAVFDALRAKGVQVDDILDAVVVIC